MRIVQLITRFDTLGGAQTHVLELSKALAKDGHEVYILYSKGQEIFGLSGEERIHCIQLNHLIHQIHPLQDFLSLQETKKILRLIQPDLVALHSSKAGIIGRLAAASLNIPTVFTAHGWAFTEGVSTIKQKIYSQIERFIAKKTDCIITVSNYDGQLAVVNQIKPKYLLKTIHNGIHDSTPQRTDREDTLNIMMVARFQTPKRQDLLVDAFAALQIDHAQLLFVGEGKELEKVKLQAEYLCLQDQVHFLGARKDVPQLLTQATIFVLLSDFEGLPLSIIEAMACGLPIVASDVGGVSELITHGENGFLVGKEKNDIHYYLNLLAENRKLREQMGEKARARFVESFQFDKTYKETLEIYEQVALGIGGNYDVSI
ncbi:glycosyltransferase family 4 protein [Kurthia sibirica]|uniref:Glycosyltransferase family 1 protein n=1 Tax=Kurthia sibirica TaxID=202750 RepID=A0A2U3AJ06_9BACL|nr:glycosyltransferase family 4 protein [Kurthia sibirica]PWI24533.1 hypothetical protein DEX24_13150 [Kurthia sibirica]GEK33602.1 glycosyl transferase [Kurthia sibirica]